MLLKTFETVKSMADHKSAHSNEVQALLEFRAFDFREIWIFAVYEQPQLYICITTTITDLLCYSIGFALSHNF